MQIYVGGYLFLQKIYHELGIHKICKEISQKYNFDFDLHQIYRTLEIIAKENDFINYFLYENSL